MTFGSHAAKLLVTGCAPEVVDKAALWLSGLSTALRSSKPSMERPIQCSERRHLEQPDPCSLTLSPAC